VSIGGTHQKQCYDAFCLTKRALRLGALPCETHIHISSKQSSSTKHSLRYRGSSQE